MVLKIVGICLTLCGLAIGSVHADRPVNRTVAAPKATTVIHGWLTHHRDAAYLRKVVAAAAAHHIDHLELSHDIVMQAEEVANEPERAKLIEDTARLGKAHGIHSVIWGHEISTRDRNAPLDPDSPEGQAFWTQRQDAYRRALRACPSVDGVVLMFGSSPYEVWERPYTPNEGDGWQRRTMPQRVKFVTDLVRAVVCDELGKQLFVRDFNHSPNQLRWIMEGLRDYPGITVISKCEPQDFQLFYPHSFTLGSYGKTAQIVETDICGEYWGQAQHLVSLAEYLPYRLKYATSKGTVGAVGRIDCFDNPVLGTPSELNLYAYDRALANPNVAASTIYHDWCLQRYHLQPATSKQDALALQKLTALYGQTLPLAKKLYYVLCFWAWKNQTSMPDSMESLDGNLRGKSSAQWDASLKPLETRLLHPDAATVREILAEKAEAVQLATRNLAQAQSLKGLLPPADVTELEQDALLAQELSRLYEAVHTAYWRVRLHEEHPDATEASPALCQQAIDALTPWITRLQQAHPDRPFLTQQSPRLQHFQQSLTKRLSSTHS